jgi:hypothetical protein
MGTHHGIDDQSGVSKSDGGTHGEKIESQRREKNHGSLYE